MRKKQSGDETEKSMKNLTKMYLKAIEERNPEPGQTAPMPTKQSQKVKTPDTTQSLRRIPTGSNMFKKKTKFEKGHDDHAVLMESRPAEFDFCVMPESLRSMIPRTPADSFIGSFDKSRNTRLSASFELDDEQKDKIETNLKNNLQGIANLVNKGKKESNHTLETSDHYRLSPDKNFDSTSSNSGKKNKANNISGDRDASDQLMDEYKKKIRELEARNNYLVNQLNSQRFLSDDFGKAKEKAQSGTKYTDLRYQPMGALIEETDTNQQILLLRHQNELLTKENTNFTKQQKQLGIILKKVIEFFDEYSKQKGDRPLRVNPYSDPVDKLTELAGILSRLIDGASSKNEGMNSGKFRQEFEGQSEISQIDHVNCDSLFDEFESSPGNVLEIKSNNDRKYRHANLADDKGNFLDRMRNLMLSMQQAEMENPLNSSQNPRSSLSSTLDLMPKPTNTHNFSRTDKVSNTDMSAEGSIRNRTLNISVNLLLEEIERVKRKLKEIEVNMKTKGGTSVLKECETVSFNISEIESSFKDLSHLN